MTHKINFNDPALTGHPVAAQGYWVLLLSKKTQFLGFNTVIMATPITAPLF
jgi:hypothetical protein